MTFFFLQTTILTLIGPLFTILRRAPEAKWPSPPKANFTPKGPPFHFLPFQGNIQNRTCPKGTPFGFFRNCATFFRKFFNVPKGSPLWVFWYFATECLLINPEGSPLLHFSALCDFFWKKNFFKNFNFFPKKVFYAFWALDMAPTLDVLVLLRFVLWLAGSILWLHSPGGHQWHRSPHPSLHALPVDARVSEKHRPLPCQPASGHPSRSGHPSSTGRCNGTETTSETVHDCHSVRTHFRGGRGRRNSLLKLDHRKQCYLKSSEMASRDSFQICRQPNCVFVRELWPECWSDFGSWWEKRLEGFLCRRQKRRPWSGIDDICEWRRDALQIRLFIWYPKGAHVGVQSPHRNHFDAGSSGCRNNGRFQCHCAILRTVSFPHFKWWLFSVSRTIKFLREIYENISNYICWMRSEFLPITWN